MIPLPEDEVHLWWTRLGDHSYPEVERQGWDLMSETERLQHGRYLFAKDRRRYLVTRALVRTVLARYLAVAPTAWHFKSTPFGQPLIANEEAHRAKLHFNVSHTDDFVVLALTCGRAIGVDTECNAKPAPLELAGSCFTSAEAHGLLALPRESRSRRFWELWTLKESYIKATGKGLSIPLNAFSIGRSLEGLVALQIIPALDDDPQRWQFWQLQPHPDHLVAFCVEARAETALRLLCWSIQDLGHATLVHPQVLRSPEMDLRAWP